MDLSGCFRVSTNVMRSIALFPNLRRLNLTKCKHFTIKRIKDIANGCRKIRAKEKRREKLSNIQLLLEIHLWADLIGKDPPLFSNCEYYDVHVECAGCSEYFCGQCWDAVHYGGKRSKHQFRVLFDYYGRRIDYRENEFPSQWPSSLCLPCSL